MGELTLMAKGSIEYQGAEWLPVTIKQIVKNTINNTLAHLTE